MWWLKKAALPKGKHRRSAFLPSSSAPKRAVNLSENG
jgi:hypothetical protein